MQKYLSISLLALMPALGMAAETEADRWNLNDLYASPQTWTADAVKLEDQLKSFAACSGHLGESAKRLKTCLDLNADIVKRLNRLSSYAFQTNDQDTGQNAGLDLKQRSEILGSKVESAASFMNPEILVLGRAKVNKLLAQEKSMAIYRHPMDEILRAAPHTLDKKGEELIANFGMATNTAQAVYATLANAEMPWPKVKLSDGTEVTINQSAYTKYRAENNRDDRKLVFDTYWGKWKEFERTMGVIFYENLRKDSANAKVRHYPDSLTQSLDAHKIPSAVYNMLIEQANANLPTLHRYFKLRAKMLDIKEMHYYDIYSPLVTSALPFTIEQGKQLMVASAKPLGEAYVAAMEQGLKERWMDVYPRPNKRSGAYMNGAAYDVHPYLLLNFNGDYESVSTLAHEWGHAMHSYLGNHTQPFVTSEYPTFTAEIASTTNETFLLDHMLKIAKTDDERLLYLGSALDGLRGTFFRQAMFADFEREAHGKVDKGESLTGTELTKIYGTILKRYHGDKENIVKIDDLYTIEWISIPHFYNRFYVFQYATSISAGSMFATEILKGTPGAQQRYLNILRAGGSKYPYELVKEAGVDLASPTPYLAVVARMNKIMDEIEAIQARKN